MPLNLMGGLLAVLLVLAVPVATRFVIAYVRSDGDFSMAAAMTGKWTMTVALSAGAAVATGLVELGAVLGGAFEFVVGHPFAVSNLGGIILGALGISGTINITTDQYIGLALMLVGIVLWLVEVDERVA